MPIWAFVGRITTIIIAIILVATVGYNYLIRYIRNWRNTINEIIAYRKNNCLITESTCSFIAIHIVVLATITFLWLVMSWAV